jgi:hypothetical protein
MSLQLASADRKILLVAGGVFVAMVVVTAFFAGGGSEDADIPSAYSTASGGCKAAFLLLQQAGYDAQTWEHPLAELPRGKGSTLVLASPAGYPRQAEKQALEKYLRGGGRVIAAGRFAGFYLPIDEEAAPPLPDQIQKQVPSVSPSPITNAAPEITLVPRMYWRDMKNVVALYGEADHPVVVQYRVGSGSVLWLADPGPLTNAGLKRTGNLEFLLAALGPPKDRRVLWDEYVHGFEHLSYSRHSRSMIAWIFLQFALLGLAIIATYSRRNGRIWNPPEERRLSPLEFVRTLGMVYERAGAGSVAVDIWYQRFRYLLTRRLGLAFNTSVQDLDRAVREHGLLSREDSKFSAVLTECESYRYESSAPPSQSLHLIQSLFDYAVQFKLFHFEESETPAWKQS